MKINRRVLIIFAVIGSLLILASVYYFGIRPGAEREFKSDVLNAMINLNKVMEPFWENYTISGTAAAKYLAYSSSYFQKAANEARILLIDSSPYNKLADVLNEIVGLLHKNSSFIYSMWATWNESEDGCPYRTISSWILEEKASEPPDEFVGDGGVANWNMLIAFLQDIVLEGSRI